MQRASSPPILAHPLGVMFINPQLLPYSLILKELLIVPAVISRNLARGAFLMIS
jgi:hypothetical protein